MVAPTVTLIPPSSQFLKFSTSCFFFHGEYNNVLIPCVFALMERKTEITDRRVWEKAQETYEALEEHICLNGFEQQFIELLNYYEDTSSDGIVVQVALSHYLPFDYAINPKELKME
ncbi:hypothetical protein HZS_3462 [Henneguya salminicola]|nr:hypothetical protein HZS_3462 [Henneguya salminicola]